MDTYPWRGRIANLTAPAKVDRERHLAYVPGFTSRRGRFLLMFTFLLVLHAIIAAALVTVILMQRSEGGGLGMGGSPSGLMSARGAADFLTRATTVLATAFVLLSIIMAVMASTRHTGTIDTSLARPAAATAPLVPAPAAPSNAAAPAASTVGNSAVPLAQ